MPTLEEAVTTQRMVYDEMNTTSPGLYDEDDTSTTVRYYNDTITDRPKQQTTKGFSFGIPGLGISSSGTVPFAIGGIVAFVLALVLMFAIVKRKKAPRGKFLHWLREYLNFRSILISGIIKFVYMFLAIFLTISSIIIMCSGRGEDVLPAIGYGFALMILGNVGLRVVMELIMALIVIWENTSDIRGVVVKKEEMPEEKMPKEPEVLKDEAVKEMPEVKPAVAEATVPEAAPVKEEIIVDDEQSEMEQFGTQVPGETA